MCLSDRSACLRHSLVGQGCFRGPRWWSCGVLLEHMSLALGLGGGESLRNWQTDRAAPNLAEHLKWVHAPLGLVLLSGPSRTPHVPCNHRGADPWLSYSSSFISGGCLLRFYLLSKVFRKVPIDHLSCPLGSNGIGLILAPAVLFFSSPSAGLRRLSQPRKSCVVRWGGAGYQKDFGAKGFNGCAENRRVRCSRLFTGWSLKIKAICVASWYRFCTMVWAVC